MTEIVGKPGNLASLLEYQKGAVVSKEIIRKDKGTVTVFAFDKGQGLSEHTAPFDAFVYVLDGSAQVFIAGRPFAVRANEGIIMPAHKPHALKALKRFKMLLVMVRA
ncbi:MAG: cupin domain-containing protein [Candidatus Omnitrophica bacterium]|nr:cupin domain-containing protein [Candidatus Omnitrophota bacterium]